MQGPVVIDRVVGGNLARDHVLVDPRLADAADTAPQVEQLDALTPGQRAPRRHDDGFVHAPLLDN